MLSRMTCLTLTGDFSPTERDGGREFPPQLSFLVSLFPCWAWRVEKVRKQHGVVVQSSHREAGKTRALSHVHDGLMSVCGLGHYALLVFLGWSLDPS